MAVGVAIGFDILYNGAVSKMRKDIYFAVQVIFELMVISGVDR